MACGDYAEHPIQYLLEWRFIDGIVCYYGDQMGVAAFLFLFAGVTFIGLQQASDSFLLPVVVTIAIAPLIAILLPAVGMQALAVMMVLMMGVVGYLAYLLAGSN